MLLPSNVVKFVFFSAVCLVNSRRPDHQISGIFSCFEGSLGNRYTSSHDSISSMTSLCRCWGRCCCCSWLKGMKNFFLITKRLPKTRKNQSSSSTRLRFNIRTHADSKRVCLERAHIEMFSSPNKQKKTVKKRKRREEPTLNQQVTAVHVPYSISCWFSSISISFGAAFFAVAL